MDNKFKYLVGYSLKKRVAKKSFLIVNIILFVLIVLLTNLGNIINFFGGDFDEAVIVYLYDETGQNASEVFKEYSRDCNFEITVKDSFDESKKDEMLKEAEALVILKVNEKGYVYADAYVNEISLTNEMALTNTVSSVKYHYWLIENPELQSELTEFNQSETINYLRSENDETAIEKTITTVLSMFIVIPTFMLLIFLIQFIGIDIIEEKSSRSIEVIISNVPSGSHFASKIVSTVIFMIIQGGLLIAYAGIGGFLAFLIGGGANESIDSGVMAQLGITSNIMSHILAKLPVTIITLLLFILVGYTMYLVLTAVLSSMATSMDNFQSYQTPVMLLLLVGFYAAIFGIQFDGAVFLKILGYIPFFSPILAPILFLSGSYGLLEIIISFVILAITTFLIIYFGMPLYKASILDYSEGSLIQKLKRVIKKAKYVE